MEWEESWRVDVKASPNPAKAEALRRSEEHIVLISNAPKPEDDPERGMSAGDLVLLYAKEYRVERFFMGVKTPMVVERLFVKSPPRADALVNAVSIGGLVRAVIQLLLRRGLADLENPELPRCGRYGGPLQRDVTMDFFSESCGDCYIGHSPSSGTYRFMDGGDEARAEAFLGLLGIPVDGLFS